MSEKLMAGVITAVVIAPICSLCIIGPAALGAFFGGMAGWFGGFDLLTIAGSATMVGILVMMKKRYAGKPASASGQSASTVLSTTPNE